MEKNAKPQNPSKVIITPKPPKKDEVIAAPSPELKEGELKVEKLEEKKTVKDTVCVKASIKSK
ncbi:MAG: hypothetical protein IKW89_08030 [Bacteroidales bacterium]|nr:hypothetical protein [Bacteroidales bacterium]